MEGELQRTLGDNVKVLRKRFGNDPESVRRFNKEAEEGMKLRHPNIALILDHGEQDRQHYMLMEYVEGSNLRDFLKIRGRLTPAESMPVMIGLAQALKYSLDQGVTHRDIKGTNILISTRGESKLVDFGLATVGGDERKMAVAHGQRTVDYSALERTCGSPKGDKRSDIFFLGCVFYQMLTGQVAMVETETKDQLAKMLKRSFSAIKPLHEQLTKAHIAIGEAVAGSKQEEITKAVAAEAALQTQMTAIELRAFAKLVAGLDQEQQGKANQVFAMMRGLFSNKDWNSD